MKSEFDLINTLREKSEVQSLESKVRLGIGDDCAVVRQNGDFDLVVTADLLVEDVDFRLAWTRPEFVGHKALAVSLSDIAAMGATPRWALISIGVPTEIWQTDFVENFYAGWFRLAKKFNVELIGGDVSRTPDKIVIDSIVAGEVRKNRAVLRSGARAGDLIFVTGELGGAAAGLKLLESGVRYEDSARMWQKKLLLKQLQPSPQVSIGEKLRKAKLATAMIDSSDGLSSDLKHLCKASKVGARIEAKKIPLHKNLRSIEDSAANQFALALDGGEDFELLFTVKPKNLKKLAKKLGKIFCIGQITEKAGEIELVGENETTRLEAKGFRHF